MALSAERRVIILTNVHNDTTTALATMVEVPEGNNRDLQMSILKSIKHATEAAQDILSLKHDSGENYQALINDATLLVAAIWDSYNQFENRIEWRSTRLRSHLEASVQILGDLKELLVKARKGQTWFKILLYGWKGLDSSSDIRILRHKLRNKILVFEYVDRRGESAGSAPAVHAAGGNRAQRPQYPLRSFPESSSSVSHSPTLSGFPNGTAHCASSSTGIAHPARSSNGNNPPSSPRGNSTIGFQGGQFYHNARATVHMRPQIVHEHHHQGSVYHSNYQISSPAIPSSYSPLAFGGFNPLALASSHHGMISAGI
ncbi:hypothetical protein B0H34DRAFT_811048 [Crassisporium funariophilum]|nr:hypothetical protein B0H34DRAFT_811048 [Crassisporium funariophilum]